VAERESSSLDMLNAGVIIYGYDSHLEGSTSFSGVDDLAGSLYINIGHLLRPGEQKGLILIGHSLGSHQGRADPDDGGAIWPDDTNYRGSFVWCAQPWHGWAWVTHLYGHWSAESVD
jgi:hypothetical protein